MKPPKNTLKWLIPTLSDIEIEKIKELVMGCVGENEASRHVRRFQCPNYGDGCWEWAEQWKSNSTPPYCSTDGRKMKSVEFDEQEGDDWVRNDLRDEIRTNINKMFGEE